MACHGAEGAPPVLYCHGWPSSRLEAALLPDPPARLIAVDRPGYGLSSPHPDGDWLDRARDMRAVMDRLGVERFHVVGVSGGGPLACACAFLMPERVIGLGLICPVPPVAAIRTTRGSLRLLVRLAPWLGGVLAVPRALMFSPLADWLVFSDAPPADRATLTPARRAALIAAFREGLRVSAAGAHHDALLYGKPFGFELGAIRVPTWLWQGDQDHLVPVATAQAYAAIPGIVIEIRADEGHYALALGQGPGLLAALLTRTAPGVAGDPG